MIQKFRSLNSQGMSVCFNSKIQDEPFCEIIKKFLDKMSHEQLLSHLNQNSADFRGIDNQTPELCAKAIELRALNIVYVKNQTVDLCLLALSQASSEILSIYEHIRIVPNPDHETTVNNLREKQILLGLLKDDSND